MGLVALAILVVSLVLFVQALFSLYLMLYTWERPERLEASSGPRSFLPPRTSFTVLLPARHEEAVIFQTIKRVWAADYPPELLEVVVVCHADDGGTIAEARRAIREIGSPRVRVETFSGKPINKPRGLNVGLERTTNEVVTIFDAEDDVDPAVFNVINTVMQEKGVGVVQAGVQLMNFRDHWFSVHNCLEYFFYFKSRLHFHAKVGMIPLGGNTVFIRRGLLDRIGGWDENCLTEDADIGLRLSELGEPIRVVYDAQHVTREETPDSVSSFVKQRTRWHQGFLQILRKDSWRSLPKLGQRLLAFYTLSYSVFQGLVTMFWPLALVAIFLIEVPTPVAMASFLPLYALLLQLVLSVLGSVVFAREYGLKYPLLMPVSLVNTFVPFQLLLGFSALRAVYREVRNQNNWEKTEHLGAHRRPEVALPTEYELLLDEALNHLDVESGSVMALDPERNILSIKTSRGLPVEVVNSTEVSVGEGVVGRVAEKGLPMVTNGQGVPDELKAQLNQPSIRSAIVLPLKQSDGTVAVLSLSSKRSKLNHDDLRWVNDRLDALFLAPAEPANGGLATRDPLASQAPPQAPNGRLPLGEKGKDSAVLLKDLGEAAQNGSEEDYESIRRGGRRLRPETKTTSESSTGEVERRQEQEKPSRSSSSYSLANKHTVVEGESLISIAEKYYGDATRWMLIWLHNKKRIYELSQENFFPDSIYPGLVLEIPRKQNREVTNHETIDRGRR